MKAYIIAPIVALLATGVVARNCTPGLNYCGHTLRDIGDYDEQIDQALHDAGHGGWDGANSLFHCVGGDNGVIKFIKGCKHGCNDNGTGNDDTCRR